jgi:hypothetical protein
VRTARYPSSINNNKNNMVNSLSDNVIMRYYTKTQSKGEKNLIKKKNNNNNKKPLNRLNYRKPYICIVINYCYMIIIIIVMIISFKRTKSILRTILFFVLHL